MSRTVIFLGNSDVLCSVVVFLGDRHKPQKRQSIKPRWKQQNRALKIGKWQTRFDSRRQQVLTIVILPLGNGPQPLNRIPGQALMLTLPKVMKQPNRAVAVCHKCFARFHLSVCLGNDCFSVAPKAHPQLHLITTQFQHQTQVATQTQTERNPGKHKSCVQNFPHLQLWLAEKSRLCWGWVYVATYVWCWNCAMFVRPGLILAFGISENQAHFWSF